MLGLPIFLNYPSDSACGFHRFLMPARYCAPAFAAAGHTIEIGSGLPDHKKHAIYGIHGLPYVDCRALLLRHRRLGGKFLWSLDDDMLHVPDWNPAKPDEDGLDTHAFLTEIADWILCSTQHLADTFKGTAGERKTLVAPNLLNLEAFPPAKTDWSFELPLRILWAGGHTHKKDVEVMEEAIATVIDQLGPQACQVVFFGQMPPPRLLKDYLRRGVSFIPPVPFAQYQNTLNSIQPQIVLAPLADVPFNYSKSNLRIIEAWGLSAAPVASAVGEYEAAITHGSNGRIVATGPSWSSAIKRLATDHQYRAEMAATGRMKVEREYDWNRPECRKPWLKAFATIFGIDVPSDPPQ